MPRPEPEDILISLAGLPAMLERVYAERNPGRTLPPLDRFTAIFSGFRETRAESLQVALDRMIQVADPQAMGVTIPTPTTPCTVNDVVNTILNAARLCSDRVPKSPRVAEHAVLYFLEALVVALKESPAERVEVTIGTSMVRASIKEIMGEIFAPINPTPEQFTKFTGELDALAEFSWGVLQENPRTNLIPTTMTQFLQLHAFRVVADGHGVLRAVCLLRQSDRHRARTHRITATDAEFTAFLEAASAMLAEELQNRAGFEAGLRALFVRYMHLPEEAQVTFRYEDAALNLSEVSTAEVVIGNSAMGEGIAFSLFPMRELGEFQEHVSKWLDALVGVGPFAVDS